MVSRSGTGRSGLGKRAGLALGEQALLARVSRPGHPDLLGGRQLDDHRHVDLEISSRVGQSGLDRSR